MIDERKIAISIPTYQRGEMTIESFNDVYNDERIAEIVINDDASDDSEYVKLLMAKEVLPKISLFKNQENLDCYFNKRMAIGLSMYEWNILLDSDNKIDKSYIDIIYSYEWDTKTIYTPSFAAPNFDFKNFSGLTIGKENVSHYIDNGIFQTLLNAANYFVNRDEYLKIWDGSLDPVTSDSIFFCLKWLEAGNKIFIVPDLTYQHRVHNGHYQQNIHRTPHGFHENILQRLRELK